ncbi:MAG: hypothetical protein FWD77_12300 [Betaproteobacteria bacterium]|nr:hypothetical protein [Betaproteobacteria bacterium]
MSDTPLHKNTKLVREQQIPLRLTDDEMIRAEQLAEQFEISRSSFVRQVYRAGMQLIFGVPVSPMPAPESSQEPSACAATEQFSSYCPVAAHVFFARGKKR